MRCRPREAAARPIMAEELAGCTVLMVAHRGAGLIGSDLRVNMACGRICTVTKDRKQGDDDDGNEGMAVGERRGNAM
ncbi:hypothetical protein BB8028_0006g09630 [Beauveria bassiana]|uniref:Uncharacterized protein n=1 Tax=Beauveria bassiana TaxID=176275 RepID=A0A2S7YKY0_BEABA|nr:hypothetical protein BB8028_0006g09630 [Beauveria bassiana]